MLNIIHKHKARFTFFATIKTSADHLIYLSAYGDETGKLLEKYLEDQREDDEEMFSEWDKSIEKASSDVGLALFHEVGDSYIYVNTFQNGIGISLEDEANMMQRSFTSGSGKVKMSMTSSLLDGNTGDEADTGTDDSDE